MPDIHYNQAHHVVPSQDPDDMTALHTVDHSNLVHAVNEVLTDLTANEAQTVYAARVAIPTNPAAPATWTPPAGAHVIGYQVVIGTVFAASSKVYIGDHSGTSGAAAPSSISGTGVAATTAGVTETAAYVAPVGVVTVENFGGDSATGAGFVIFKYIAN